jgi:predicted permease
VRVQRIIGHRLHSLLRRSRAEADMRREIDVHIEQLTRECIAAGMRGDEAGQRARREFGPVELIKEQCRDMRRVNFVDDLLKDLAYAVRVLAKSPGFTLTAVLSLVLGIGANVAIFTLVDAVLLRTLPVNEPRQLLEVSRAGGGRLSYPMYERIRKGNAVFTGVLAIAAGRLAGSARVGERNAGDVHFSPVSGDYFRVLGLSPAMGRTLTEEDLAPATAAVISHEFWQRALDADPAVLGKTMRLGRGTYTIVGVAPAGFRGITTGQPVDVWIPVTWVDRQSLANPEALMFHVIGRRKPGVSEEQARANMAVLGRQWDAEWKFDWKAQLDVASASGGLTSLRRRFSRPLLVLMTVVGLLLLIASVNVANLLLARASARQREIAVRLSLGASRARLIRQLLTESCVLGGIGGLLGLLLAPAATAFLVRFLSSAVGTVDLPLGIDVRMVSFALALLVAVVFLFGLAPALAATRLDLTGMFKGGGATSGRSRRAARSGKVLVVVQVAVCCVLLTGAVLFARSLQTLTRVDAGFRPENVLLMQIGAGEELTGTERVRLYERVRQRFERVPGVRSVALSSERLFGGNAWTESISTAAFVPSPGQSREAILLVVSPSFFQTMDTTMLRGRDFDARDDEHGAPVAIVNEAAARYFFGASDPMGQRITVEGRNGSRPFTVAGLVRDARYRSLKEAAPRIIYLPLLQGAPDEAYVAVRTIGDPEKMTEVLSREARAERQSLRVGASTPQARLVEGTMAQDLMLAQLSACFGLAAAIMVCLGLYGVTAYDVSRRTAEIALRMALGAQRGDVIRSVVGESMLLVTMGVAAGLGAAMGLARFVQSLLFGVEGTDLATLTVTAAMLVAVGVMAAYWPARRGAAVDPIAALRRE